MLEIMLVDREIAAVKAMLVDYENSPVKDGTAAHEISLILQIELDMLMKVRQNMTAKTPPLYTVHFNQAEEKRGAENK